MKKEMQFFAFVSPIFQAGIIFCFLDENYLFLQIVFQFYPNNQTIGSNYSSFFLGRHS